MALFCAASISCSLRAQDARAPLSTTGTSTNSAVADQENRDIKPRDTLKFNILEDPEGRGLFPLVQVTDFGDAQFPISASTQEYITIKAAGRHLADLRAELKQKLDADFYQDATISLDLHSVAGADQRGGGLLNSGRVLIYGSVNATIPLKDEQKLTLSEVFAMLGGQTQYANLKKVEVMRMDPVTKQSTPMIKNVKKMLDGDLSEDIPLMDGDRIKVEDRKVIF